jgi:hypothetical protein
MGLKLAVVVVSANRHCPALGLLQTRLYILPCRATESRLAWRWTNKHPLAGKQIPSRKQSTMPRKNGWHHRKGVRSESHEIKGEVFQARILSVWRETRPHQKMRPAPRDIKQSSG